MGIKRARIFHISKFKSVLSVDGCANYCIIFDKKELARKCLYLEEVSEVGNLQFKCSCSKPNLIKKVMG